MKGTTQRAVCWGGCGPTTRFSVTAASARTAPSSLLVARNSARFYARNTSREPDDFRFPSKPNFQGSLYKSREQMEREKHEELMQFYGFKKEPEEIDPTDEPDFIADEEQSEEDLYRARKGKYEPIPWKRVPEEDDDPEEELQNLELDEVSERLDPSWHRDFSYSKQFDYIDPREESAVSLPTSWYEYSPFTHPRRGIDEDLDDADPKDTDFERVVYVGRHTNVTKGGRISSYSAMVIDGDGRGNAGYGYGRGLEPNDALEVAKRDLKKNMVHIDRWEDRTLAYGVRAQFCKSIVQLFVFPATTMAIPKSCYHMNCVFKAFGLEGVAGKFIGSRNRKNCIKALFKAIQLVEHPDATAKRLGVKFFNHKRVWRPGQPRVWSY